MHFKGTQHSGESKCDSAPTCARPYAALLANLPEIVTSEYVASMKDRTAASSVKSVWKAPERCPVPTSREQALREGWVHDRRSEKAYFQGAVPAGSEKNPNVDSMNMGLETHSYDSWPWEY